MSVKYEDLPDDVKAKVAKQNPDAVAAATKKPAGDAVATATGKAAARSSSTSTRKATASTKKAPARRRATSTSTRRKAKRVARSVPRQVRSARSGSVAGILTASIVLVGLYVFLEAGANNPDRVPAFLAGPQKALRWLSSPTAVIPFKEGASS